MRWLWIDKILVLEKGRRCVAIKHVRPDEQHLLDHFPSMNGRPAMPVMPASLIIEGMAQTAGILVGHVRDFKEKVLLAKIGLAEFQQDVPPGRTLVYTAIMDRMDEAGASASGVVELAETSEGALEPSQGRRSPVGRIELIFSHADKNLKGLELPEHNFVFTETFFDLLKRSGFAAP